MSKAALQAGIKTAIKADLTNAGFNLSQGEADVLADSVGDVVAEQVINYLTAMLTAGVPTPTDGGAALKTTMLAYTAIP